jgi:predicted ArsR family transcriptional regulator
MSEKQIIARLTRKSKTAAELGVDRSTLVALEAKGLVIRAGFQKTGKRGRPAVIWAAVVAA